MIRHLKIMLFTKRKLYIVWYYQTHEEKIGMFQVVAMNERKKERNYSKLKFVIIWEKRPLVFLLK